MLKLSDNSYGAFHKFKMAFKMDVIFQEHKLKA